MSFKQIGEPEFKCMDCGRNYSISQPDAQFGLWRNGELIKCSKCFEEMKHQFWLERMEQE
jgi:DNA-directed RNA polymerase subunit RPC12/RpoP